LQHYSPRAELIYSLGPGSTDALAILRQIAEEEISRGRRVGVLVVEEDQAIFSELPVIVASLGSASDLWQAAHRLYAGMRALDEQQVDVILARDLGDQGPGLALRDRLRRAAHKVIS
jgi:L-threonylcarbamoyladenylate synthase